MFESPGRRDLVMFNFSSSIFVIMNVAEYISNQLADLGVRYVYGIPGGPSIPYMEALKKDGIDFILTSNESAAGIMADVTARLTGVPGICHATFGPGATNITTGVGGALLDRSPVIVFTSEMPDNMISRTTQMNINHQDLFRPVTKATFRMNPSNAESVMTSAIRICRESYPGPVHIGLPSDIANSFVFHSPKPEPVNEVSVFHNDIQRITSLIRKARKPLIAVGLTAFRLGLNDELNTFLQVNRIPVVITPMAKGILNEEHPCYAGVLFHSLSNYLENLYSDTDLIIGLGYDPVEFNYESWVPDVPLIHFDIKETDMPQNGKCIQYVGQPDEWFTIIRNLVSQSTDENAIKKIKDQMTSVFDGFTSHFGPVSALKVLRELLPEDAILTADVGSHLHLLGQYWKTNGKGRFIITNGWSGMGFGIPSALAAQLIHPEKSVVCVTGDGGFLMMAGELITAKRYNLPVKIVVFSDGELNLIKVKQSWKGINPYGTQLYNGDMFESDSFLGVSVLNADSSETMRAVVKRALSMNEPVIINALIDPEEYNRLIVKR